MTTTQSEQAIALLEAATAQLLISDRSHQDRALFLPVTTLDWKLVDFLVAANRMGKYPYSHKDYYWFIDP